MQLAEPNEAAVKGGRARAAALTPEARREIAKKAADARWRPPRRSGTDLGAIPTATHTGELRIADLVLPCAVLEDGTRLISESGMIRALGGKRGGAHWRRMQGRVDGTYLPIYLSASNLAPFVSPSLAVALSRPIPYRPPRTRGAALGYGVEARLIPEICDVWLKARDANALLPRQQPLAARADVLMRGLAHVGIIALVDEATGFQEQRDRDELSRILEAYISKELLPWARVFPDEFYEHLFRLRGWSYRPLSVTRPKIVGKLTAELVYEKLPPGVLDELRRLNPKVSRSGRRHKHHQFLTQDIGHPHLQKHLVAVTTLMKVAPNWTAFMRMFSKAFPPAKPYTRPMFADEVDDELLTDAAEPSTRS